MHAHEYIWKISTNFWSHGFSLFKNVLHCDGLLFYCCPDSLYIQISKQAL